MRLRAWKESAGAVLLAVSLAACDDGPASPTPAATPLTELTSSRHYVIHSAPGDRVDTAWQDGYYEWLLTALELQDNGRLEYFKYQDRGHLRALTGRDTNGFADPGTNRFHTIWPSDNHEGVHTLVILQIGHPPALFNEGVAVAHQVDPSSFSLRPQWNRTDLDLLARGFAAAGRIPALPSLLASTDFFRLDVEVTYPLAGSFVRYLLDEHGLRPFKQYVAAARFDDAPARTELLFEAAYGRSLASAWDAWRQRIR